MKLQEDVRACFINARKDEEKGKKHKGLLNRNIDNKKAEEYILKAKKNIELCEYYKIKGFDYKIPEEWFYTMYYCALAILSKFGAESRSQRCTALFLRYIKDKELIAYDDEFIDRINVFREKEVKSDVDERENSRYSSSVKSEDIIQRYEPMMDVCRRCISQCEEIVFSRKKLEIPKELLDAT